MIKKPGKAVCAVQDQNWPFSLLSCLQVWAIPGDSVNRAEKPIMHLVSWTMQTVGRSGKRPS